jgi:hypothetical protein
MEEYFSKNTFLGPMITKTATPVAACARALTFDTGVESTYYSIHTLHTILRTTMNNPG